MPINFNSFPLREFEKSRKLQWFPEEIDFSLDKSNWPTLNKLEQDILLRQVVAFLIGERAVTHDLAPLQQALRREKGRMEEEMYLTAQMFEESIHVQFFQRWMNEVLPGQVGRDIPFPPVYGTVFSHLLPEAMQAVLTDPSPRAQLRASITYHQVVEGVLGELGYQIFYACLLPRTIMPGLEEGIRKVQRDEARHIAFGTYFCQRIISENAELAAFFEEEMERLRPHASDSVDQLFEPYNGSIPFGLNYDKLKKMANDLVDTRIAAVRRGALVGS
jgi:ribonucleoside-diphosphate reductase beta chain